MERVVCPACGALNFRGFLTYPVCHQCHENLTQCGYCRHFPGEGVPCLLFADEAPVVESSVRDCASFELGPRHASSPAESRPLRGALWAGGLVVGLLALLGGAASLLRVPDQEPHTVEVKTTFVDEVTVGETVTVTLVLRNRAAHRTERLRLRAPGDGLTGVDCASVTPGQEGLVTGRSKYFALPPLAPGQSLSVEVVLRPREPGEQRCALQLVCSDAFVSHDVLGRALHIGAPVAPESQPAEAGPALAGPSLVE